MQHKSVKYGLSATCLVLLASTVVTAQPIDKEKRSRTIKLTERAGLARSQSPVEVTVRFEAGTLKDPTDVRLFRVNGAAKTPVARQVLETASYAATDSFAPARQSFVRVAFLADVPANGTATYEVALEGAKPSLHPTLKVSGDGVDKAIDTGPVLFDLHKPSGQLLSFSPKSVSGDRLVFLQHKERGALPFHWNPDVWLTGGGWGHTSDWNATVVFDPTRHKAESLPAHEGKSYPFFFRETQGPLVYRSTRWGNMPMVPGVSTSVTYTFFAGSPAVAVQSLVEFREGMSVHAVRNAELVFSRHQFDTAVWIDKAGRLQRVTCYDYNDKDRSFGEFAKLPADVPCLGLANERKGYGIAYVTLGLAHLGKHTGQAADEGAHFYIRDYDEHGKGSPANFLYFARPVVYRDGYFPTAVSAGSIYAENAAIVVFRLGANPAKRYDELARWQKTLANALEVLVD
jgi:hypothetical protein